MTTFRPPRIPSRAVLALALSSAALAGCSTDATEHASTAGGYTQTNLVANWSAYKPQIVEKDLKNAWGISLRPAGAGGHFWITANGSGTSFEYVGDVAGAKLHQDDLKEVSVPGVAEDAGTPTGTVFNEKGDGFVITQEVDGAKVRLPAKFLFSTDEGLVTAWTEQKKADGKTARPTDSVTVWDRSGDKASYLGMAISPRNDRLYLADFGAHPRVVVLDDTFTEIPDPGFTSPFGKKYQPFNVQAVGDSIFVSYAAWGEPGEEEPAPGAGRLAEFTPGGTLVRVWNGGRYLNAPWGIARAPKGFGTASGDLLVSNFGDGTITVLDSATHRAVDFLRRPDGHRVEIDGIWGITFGNGESLGRADALYFAAGPGPEADGIFGRLTWKE
jgi:uncharacterized protein (TIGR03118 family)